MLERLKCALGLHRWSKWRDQPVQMIRTFTGAPVGAPRMGQLRHCERCNLEQIR